MANNNIISALDEQFYIDCEVIETKYEYPQYTGVEKWIIVTDLTEEKLNSKYAEQVAPLRPFIVLSRSFSEVRNDFRRNEKKFQMRAVRSIEPFNYDDDLLMAHHPELIVEPFTDSLCNEKCQKVRDALSTLNPIQKQRIIKYFFDGLNTIEIAKEEGCSHQAVRKSINAAINNLKKTL